MPITVIGDNFSRIYLYFCHIPTFRTNEVNGQLEIPFLRTTAFVDLERSAAAVARGQRPGPH